MKNKSIIWMSLLAGMTAGTVRAELTVNRSLEPVVLQGNAIPDVRGIPVDEIFVFAYRNGAWHMIPFQIDERLRIADPELNDRMRHFYAIANTNPVYAMGDTIDPAFDGDDELAFMVRDLGGKAPGDAELPDDEAWHNPIIELTITDPDPVNPEKAYAYIVRSTTLSMPAEVANTYNFQYDPATHQVQNDVYMMRTSLSTGFISDIAINPPYGNGADLFDAQKMRMNGHMDWAGLALDFGPQNNDAPSATEEKLFYVFDNNTYLAYTDKPVVRVIQEIRQAIKFGRWPLDKTEFYANVKFYPFSAVYKGGTVLDPDSIRTALGDSTVDIFIAVDYIRQSWDFSAEATGMKFYNPVNSGVTVDGLPDAVNTHVDMPSGDDHRLQTWTLMSGNQGTFFNLFDLAESNWDEISLYYYDNKNGGQADNEILNADDTGDGVSYGDHGMRFGNTVFDKPLNLDFGFTAVLDYPDQNETKANILLSIIQNPVTVSIAPFITGVEQQESKPRSFGMLRNFPNPFNMETRFMFTLEKESRIRLDLIDQTGRRVYTIQDSVFPAGEQSILWNAASAEGIALPSGTYIVRLTTARWQEEIKIVIVK